MQSLLDEPNSKIVGDSKKKTKNRKKYLISNESCLMLFGSIAIILGLSLMILQSTIMSFTAEMILNLNSDSAIFRMWQKYPMKVPYEYIFFNWTNHREFFNKSVKLKFEEVGPYTYLQDIEKVDIVRNDNNNTITFKQIRTFRYDNDLSNNGNISDQLTTINYFAMFGGHFLRDSNSALKDLYSEYISLLDPYYYFDTTIDDEVLKGHNSILLEISNYLDFILPDFPHVDGFGWAKIRSADPNFEGIYNIANGVNREFDVLNWNYYSSSPYYNESCNKIKGLMGDVFSFPLSKESINIFVPDICRYVTLYFGREVIVDGVKGYKYSFTKLSFDNGTLNPKNKCFCVGDCLPSGVLGISSCRYNLNGYVSLPHFYNGDPTYLTPFEGLNPEKEKHETYIVIEPYSLLCLEVKLAAQLNILVNPVEGISAFADYPKLYFPLFWMRSRVQLPEFLKKYLKMYLYVPCAIIVGAIILITSGIFAICYGLHKLNRLRLLQISQNIAYE